MTAPKTDTQAPERIWTYSQAGCEGIQGQWRPIDMRVMYGPMTEYLRADISAAREAAAAQAMREAVLAWRDNMKREHPSNGIAYAYFTNCANSLVDADAQAALDRLIAERVREAFEEAADMAANRGQQMLAQELRARGSKDKQ